METQTFWDVFLGEPEDGGSMVIRNNDNIYQATESVTISMEQSHSWLANGSSSASQETSRTLWNSKVRYRIHRRRHLFLSWARTIQSTPTHPILMLFSHLRLGSPSGLFPSSLLTKTLYTPLLSLLHATCPAHRQRVTSRKTRRRLNSRTNCSYSVQYIVSYRLQPKKFKIQKSIISLTFVCCVEVRNSSHTKEETLNVSQNSELKREGLVIFKPKAEKETGDWGRLHNEELANLHSFLNIIRMTNSRRINWARNVVSMREQRNEYSILVGKPAGKRPLWRPRRKWKSIKR